MPNVADLLILESRWLKASAVPGSIATAKIHGQKPTILQPRTRATAIASD